MPDYLSQGREMTSISTKLAYLCKIAVVAVLIPSLSHAVDWEIQVVESDTGQIEDAAIDMVVDANGISHVVYYKNDGYNLSLVYSVSDTNQWHSFPIEDNTIDYYSQDHKVALAVDENGVIYVVYPDNDNKLVYRKKQNGQWSRQIRVDLDHSIPYDAAVDNDGLLNVVYAKTVSGDIDLIFYKSPDTYQAIEQQGNYQSASLAIGSDSKPRVCYYDEINSLLKYAVKDGNSWPFETVDDSIGDVASYVWGSADLTLDGNNVPHISYYHFADLCLKYAKKLPGGWTPETVDDTSYIGQQTSITVDSNGRVHICYQVLSDGVVSIKYAVGSAQGWQYDTITSFNQPKAYLSIDCDGNDKSHICYVASSRQTVEYAVEQICADPDKNCMVDFFDLGRLGLHWLDTGCTLPDYCEGADIDKSTVVDNNDLGLLAETWLVY